jgi:triacylglycerol lipase
MMSLLSPIGAARPSAQVIGRAAVAQVQELGVMAAVAAMAPLGRAGRSLERAVDALLPVAGHAASTARPVLLVHGFAGTKSCWFALTRALRARGMTVDAIDYLPFGTSVERLADRLAVKVASLLAETGADKVHLVGHSLGGVIIAQAFADGRLTGQVDTVVTIAAPFGGSPWANLLPLGATVRALRDGSPLLRRLATAPVPDGVQWVAFTATLDMIVPGRRSVPAQAGVRTVTVDNVGHVGLLLSQQVVGRIVDALPKHERAVA